MLDLMHKKSTFHHCTDWLDQNHLMMPRKVFASWFTLAHSYHANIDRAMHVLHMWLEVDPENTPLSYELAIVMCCKLSRLDIAQDMWYEMVQERRFGDVHKAMWP